jgi:hypothetical protein
MFETYCHATSWFYDTSIAPDLRVRRKYVKAIVSIRLREHAHVEFRQSFRKAPCLFRPVSCIIVCSLSE